ncbi:MAG: ABC transporter permease [Anaerolineae bacterium]|jgi:simple sugar transport system permease protein|nr:ABC transporter permease [Anaerolineae bacterium]
MDDKTVASAIANAVQQPKSGAPTPKGQHRRGGWLRQLLVPLLAIITALILGALVIAFTDESVFQAFGGGFGRGVGQAFSVIGRAYGAFFSGAFGNPVRIISALISGQGAQIRRAIYPLMETLRISTPYIFAGLAVALGFQGGVFNIGAEGQYFIAGLVTVFVGYAIKGLPAIVHLPLALLAGVVGGGLWGAIPGYLKAKTGAHEVINTIMLNYIAFRLAEFMLDANGLMARGDGRPVSPEIQPSAYLPQFFPNQVELRVNVGFFLALAAAALVWWLLYKTTLGYEIRTVGANPRAARYAGMSVARTIVITMALSGALAGLSASTDILGVLHYMPNAFSSGYGFDAIALALLGKSHPFGVVLASLLFGALRAGAQNMQGIAQVPVDLTSIVQGLIIVFIAAPEIIRKLYRLRQPVEGEELVTVRGWGGA